MKKKIFLFAALLLVVSGFAQRVIEVKPLPDECWWGGAVAYGNRMPYIQPLEEYDLSSQNHNNQVVPLNEYRAGWQMGGQALV